MTSPAVTSGHCCLRLPPALACATRSARFKRGVCVSAIELRCDVTIAAHARSSRTDGRSAVCLLLHTHSVSWCWSINSSQASLFPRSVLVCPARALAVLRLCPSIHRPGPFIHESDQLFSCTTRVCVVTLLPGFFCV